MPSRSNFLNFSRWIRRRGAGGIWKTGSAVARFKKRNWPVSFLPCSGSTWIVLRRSKSSAGRHFFNAGKAQWIVIPHPWLRASICSSRSKIRNGIPSCEEIRSTTFEIEGDVWLEWQSSDSLSWELVQARVQRRPRPRSQSESLTFLWGALEQCILCWKFFPRQVHNIAMDEQPLRAQVLSVKLLYVKLPNVHVSM